MTREKYKAWLALVSSKENIAQRMELFAQDRAFAKELQEHNPELAKLMERNVSDAEEFYACLKNKLEIN